MPSYNLRKRSAADYNDDEVEVDNHEHHEGRNHQKHHEPKSHKEAAPKGDTYYRTFDDIPNIPEELVAYFNSLGYENVKDVAKVSVNSLLDHVHDNISAKRHKLNDGKAGAHHKELSNSFEKAWIEFVHYVAVTPKSKINTQLLHWSEWTNEKIVARKKVGEVKKELPFSSSQLKSKKSELNKVGFPVTKKITPQELRLQKEQLHTAPTPAVGHVLPPRPVDLKNQHKTLSKVNPVVKHDTVVIGSPVKEARGH